MQFDEWNTISKQNFWVIFLNTSTNKPISIKCNSAHKHNINE